MPRRSRHLEPDSGFVSSEEMIREARRSLALSTDESPSATVARLLADLPERSIPSFESVTVSYPEPEAPVDPMPEIDLPPLPTERKPRPAPRPQRVERPVPAVPPTFPYEPELPVPLPRSPRRSGGVARGIATLIWLIVLGFGAIAVFAPSITTTITDSITESVTELQPIEMVLPGECIGDITGDPRFVEVVPCSDPHRFVMLGTVVADDPYPGDEFDPGRIFEMCAPLLDETDAVWDIQAVIPTPGAWDAGDRTVSCLRAT